MKKLIIGFCLTLFSILAVASNGILNAEIQVPPGTLIWNPCGEWMTIDEGETLRLVLRDGPKKNGGYQIINHVVGHVTATGEQYGFHYIGNLVAGLPGTTGTPPGYGSVFNISPDGKGAGMVMLRSQFVSPDNPDFGVGVIDNMTHVIFEGDPLNPTIINESYNSVCHGSH